MNERNNNFSSFNAFFKASGKERTAYNIIQKILPKVLKKIFIFNQLNELKAKI